MRNKLIAFALLFICIGSCTKSTLQEEKFYYGAVQIDFVALPNTQPVDVRFKDTTKVSLTQGAATWSESALAGTAKRLSVYKSGTDSLIADTLITLPKDDLLYLKVGYIESLGVKGFLTPSASIHPDSCVIQLYDDLTTYLQPDNVNLDVYMFNYDAENDVYVDAGIVFKDFTKKKLHPLVIKAPARQVAFRLKNTATGEFVKDAFNGDLAIHVPEGGKSYILTIYDRIIRGKQKLSVTATEL